MTTTSAKLATLGGGCFWCMQPPFDALPGVVSTRVGYSGGKTPDPTYEEVCEGGTGHAEAVEVSYDPAKVPYEKLLDVFWRQIDPTTPNRQFADAGTQYRTAVFYHDEEQRAAAEKSKRELAASGRFDAPIVTEIVPAGPFYEAEDHHQKYYEKRTLHYKLYRAGSGREAYLKRTWEG
jgi:methionine-S-sulfoxide reductase